MQLSVLDLLGCEKLQNVEGIANLTKLSKLYLRRCCRLQNIDRLANLD